MDWSKATTILIIALLAVCLILSGILVYRNEAAKKADAQAIVSAVEYLESQGVSPICDIPSDRPALPVLFIHFNAASPEVTNTLKDYLGYPVVTGASDAFVPEITSVGNAKAKVISASSAVLKAVAGAGEMKGLEIRSVKLVYYVETEGFNPMSEDTALPCWAVETNRGIFYVNAYAV